MATTLVLLITLSRAALAAVAGILTPTPYQPGMPSNCDDFRMAIPGDTCGSFADKTGKSLPELLQLNPQIGGAQSCPQNLFAYNWYCMHTAGGAHPLAPRPTTTTTTTTAAAAATISDTAPRHGVEPPVGGDPFLTLAKPTPKPAASEPTAQAPAPHTTPRCAVNECWRAFGAVPSFRAPFTSSWCSSVLSGAPVQETNLARFPGISPWFATACAMDGLGDGGQGYRVVSSYCSCYVGGGIVPTPASTPGAFVPR
ncbi:hypothetical protein VTK73DRAFT_7814 [Phialemonium thermophilum]|uniref:LysM domain-containing protein n=1 Tax=Phialemonium thermophilum TaxID=223376 RepID=A0ABR3WD02_9PEZI